MQSVTCEEDSSGTLQAQHTAEKYLPLNGEFMMAPGAGFAAFDGAYDPGCETGSEVTFSSAENYHWYDPTLWHAATSLDDLERGKYIFSVDEECVPCQHDDVLFRPETSFRINIESSEQMIRLRSISLMGQKFTSNDALAEYMQSPSAKLQFHGEGAFQLSHTRCPDKSGCECANAANHHRICAALLQNSGNRCPVPLCKDPLMPVGHCCGICGATISLEYSAGFDIEMYRNRILHTFLNMPKNAGVQMALSKVQAPPRTFLGIVPRSPLSLIQIVLIDNRTGAQTGTHAEQLAKDIMGDIAENGESFGVVLGHFQAATGTNWEAQGAGGHVAATTAGAVVGLLLVLLLSGVVLLLYRKGALRSLSSVSFSILWSHKNLHSMGETNDEGFDNPMFDTPSNPMAFAGVSVEERVKDRASKISGLYYINPLYDETEVSA
ncbi:protein amnionless isoform X2 [Hemicordylus capensis]|uniref:protein amnionless isoform X2 n=1 Tax=Hemicordylus capensis TaxID=884348 RepID=UPI0023039588|nr:protein amnionless isoform X2 [Hemicordylus capensis]